ncbi:unnamed protein product [Brassicogethes aeneus]|uniref:Uncharacterized protein n=1 Tax=Brassicogethes aeneus TaxID=1431903 RepID=A0A9P0B1T8_BRAAE|nr:unnamed protein product [Brassicogethes aeneus]
MFHQDNSQANKTAITIEKIKEVVWKLLLHPPYFPNLAPCDFSFSGTEKSLAGKRYTPNASSNQTIIICVDILLIGLIEHLDADPELCQKIIFSDEAHFWLNGFFKQNCRIWSKANPQEVNCIQKRLLSARQSADDDTRFLLASIGGNGFGKHGAIYHTLDLIAEIFSGSVISRNGDINWPARSCDLTPLEFFLWGYVKSLVYANKPQTIEALRDNIRHVIGEVGTTRSLPEYDCRKDDGTECQNGACLDNQCHCNDGYGGCSCEVPEREKKDWSKTRQEQYWLWATLEQRHLQRIFLD